MSDELTAKLVPENVMHDLRDELSEQHPDVIAVVVLSGSPNTGLAMSVSSHLTERETIALLLHAASSEL